MSEPENTKKKPWFYRVKGSAVGPSMSSGKFVPASFLGTAIFAASLITLISGIVWGIQAYRVEAWGLLALCALGVILGGGVIWFGVTFRSEDHPYGY